MKNSGASVLGFTLAFGIGILIGFYCKVAPSLAYMGAVLFLVVSFIAHRFNRTSAVFMFLAIAAFGIFYCENHQTLPKNHVAHIARYYQKEPVVLQGVIVSDVERRHSFRGQKTTFILDVRNFKTRWGWQQKTGKVLVNLFSARDICYGDYITIEGKLHRPFNFGDDEKFSYRDYLSRRGIQLILSVKKQGRVEIERKGQGNPLASLSLKSKHRFSEILDRYLSKEAAAIMQAFLLGDRYNIPQSVNELFKSSGTVHIMPTVETKRNYFTY